MKRPVQTPAQSPKTRGHVSAIVLPNHSPPRQSRGITTGPCRGVSRTALCPNHPNTRPISQTTHARTGRRSSEPTETRLRTPRQRAPNTRFRRRIDHPPCAHIRHFVQFTVSRHRIGSTAVHRTAYHAASPPDRVGAFRETPCTPIARTDQNLSGSKPTYPPPATSAISSRPTPFATPSTTRHHHRPV